jgi:hypothetical protein
MSGLPRSATHIGHGYTLADAEQVGTMAAARTQTEKGSGMNDSYPVPCDGSGQAPAAGTARQEQVLHGPVNASFWGSATLACCPKCGVDRIRVNGRGVMGHHHRWVRPASSRRRAA